MARILTIVDRRDARAGAIAARFWINVEPGRADDECWPWRGRPDHRGRGSFMVFGRSLHAAQAAYILEVGPIPPGLCVLHRCDNPPCCNPAHLFLGTQADNMADMAAKGRADKTQKPRGDAHWMRRQPHRIPRGDACGSTKLTDAEVRAIRVAHAAGRDTLSLAQEYGVIRGTIQRIVYGRARLSAGTLDAASDPAQERWAL